MMWWKLLCWYRCVCSLVPRLEKRVLGLKFLRFVFWADQWILSICYKSSSIWNQATISSRPTLLVWEQDYHVWHQLLLASLPGSPACKYYTLQPEHVLDSENLVSFFMWCIFRTSGNALHIQPTVRSTLSMCDSHPSSCVVSCLVLFLAVLSPCQVGS